jgi:hypothetical protein
MAKKEALEQERHSLKLSKSLTSVRIRNYLSCQESILRIVISAGKFSDNYFGQLFRTIISDNYFGQLFPQNYGRRLILKKLYGINYLAIKGKNFGFSVARRHKNAKLFTNVFARGRCYDQNFLRFLPIFDEKIGGLLENPCYDQFFSKTSSILSKERL